MPVIDANECAGCNLRGESLRPGFRELVEGIAARPRPNECDGEEPIAACRDQAIRT
jgi:hypothetical protein